MNQTGVRSTARDRQALAKRDSGADIGPLTVASWRRCHGQDDSRFTYARTPSFDFAQDPGGRVARLILAWHFGENSARVVLSFRGASLRRAGEGARPYVFAVGKEREASREYLQSVVNSAYDSGE